MNINKGGFPQTLYNIFSFIDPENFLFITSLKSYKIALPSQPFTSRTLTYNFELIHHPRNRLGRYTIKFIHYLNYSVNQLFDRFKKLKAAIKNFNPDIVITAPNSAEGIFMHYRLKPAFKHKKVFPYFMDDWLYQSNLNWAGGNIHILAKELLRENTAWLMISESLGNILGERYQIKPSRLLEIHNPVDMRGVNKPLAVQKKEGYNLAYAGALWQMHFDAFLIIAKAINILQNERKINLVVYTSESNWKWRKAELKNLNVIYGGYIPYRNIHAKLAEADCLLITSSFSEEWQTHSKGSVQTKITDYLKAGRLIISCGPNYSANHNFLKKYNCGICIETNDVQKVGDKLNNILNNIEVNQKYVVEGLQVLKTEFSFENVHQKLKDFLAV